MKISGFDAVFVRLRVKIDRKIINKARKLKYILTATTGLDHIDTDYFESVGGSIISLRNETAFLSGIPSTAEHTWALLLALIKKIPSASQHAAGGNWDRNLFIGNNLKSQKLGILGLGRVGLQVAAFAEAFGMEIGFYDIIDIESKFRKFDSPKELFSWADIITIHIPMNKGNANFITGELMECLKKGAHIVNTSRGGVWDEHALAELLRQNKISGIATDVLGNEHDKDMIAKNPLVVLANNGYNVIITPHIAGATFESMRMTEEFVAEKFLKTVTRLNS